MAHETISHERAVADRSRPMGGLQRLSGLSLVAGGWLYVMATVLHPSREDVADILANEPKLVGSHVVYVAAYVLILLGLPGFYAARLSLRGTSGLVWFLGAFWGTAILAITSFFGFMAPILAAEAPDALDAVTQYLPVVVLTGLATTGFLLGFTAIGVYLARSTTPTWPGLLIAVGLPVHLFAFAGALLSTPAIWPLAVIGSVGFGGGLAWIGRDLLADR